MGPLALAAAGELEHNGERLPPFETNQSTVRSLARQRTRQRMGHATSELATRPPGDAVEALRRRLVNLADAGLTRLERELRRRGARLDFEQVRQAARAVREIAALPGPEDPRPPSPGERVGGQRNGGATRGGLAGELVAAHRAAPAPAPADRIDDGPRRNGAADAVESADPVAAENEKLRAESSLVGDAAAFRERELARRVRRNG
jgi:hypothetical protein